MSFIDTLVGFLLAAPAFVAFLLAVPEPSQEPFVITDLNSQTITHCFDGPDGSSECLEHVQVIDGDTLVVDGVTVKLWGIDAPELDQRCYNWDAGEDAQLILLGLAGRLGRCDAVGPGPGGQTLARCFDWYGRDIGALMVEGGHAWEDRRYSGGYYAQQSEIAAGQRDALSALDCEPPWEWRAEHLQP